MKILFLTNIPTPYRHYFYEQLAKNIEIHVAYLAKTEIGRSWDYKEYMNLEYSSFVPSNNLVYKRKTIYFIKAFESLIENVNPDVLIIAGSWIYPSTLQIIFNKKYRKRMKVGFWSEGNFVDEVTSKRYLIKQLKKKVYNSFDFFLSPGERADELINFYTKDKKIIRLTNIAVPKISHGKPRNPKEPFTICIISRLMKRKNVLGYLLAIKDIIINDSIKIDILGDGPESPEIQEMINLLNVNYKIKLHGQVASESVYKFIKNSDALCLPSLRDPYPLTLVEGLFLSKPLLISKDIGSMPEVLQNNGFSFDPNDENEMNEQTKRMIESSPEELLEFSQKSLSIAKKLFDPEKVIQNFVEDMISYKSEQKELNN